MDLKQFCFMHDIKNHNEKVFQNKRKNPNKKNNLLTEKTKALILSHYKDDLALWKRASTNVIYIYWAEGIENAPEAVQLCALSWKQMNPTWILYQLDDENLTQHISNMEILDKNRSMLSREDYTTIVGITLMQEHGGVWVEPFMFCHEPLVHWLHKSYRDDFFAFTDPLHKISCSFLYAQRECHLIRFWLHKIQNTVLEKPQQSFWINKLLLESCQEDEICQNTLHRLIVVDNVKLTCFQTHLDTESGLVQRICENNPNLSPFREYLSKKKKIEN
jgi:hypothetical protein